MHRFLTLILSLVAMAMPQIARLVQLNEGQPYTYDRDALIKMLDDSLSHARPKTQ